MFSKHRYSSKNGFVLISVILIIVITMIIIVGMTTFILQRSQYSQIRLDSIKAHYAAQAGIEWAFYMYRLNGYVPLGPQTIDDNKFIISSSQADQRINTDTTTLNNDHLNFTIESKGIAGNNIFKILRAEYNTNTSKIVDFHEK